MPRILLTDPLRATAMGAKRWGCSGVTHVATELRMVQGVGWQNWTTE